jgi:hypothetical protein
MALAIPVRTISQVTNAEEHFVLNQRRRMKMAKARSGGGITSNKLVQSKAPKVEPRSKAISPEGVAQLGAATAFQKKPLDMGPGYQPVGPTSNMGQGPGANRTTYKCGSQGLQGSVNPGHSAPAKDILGSFGPDRRNG